MRHTTIFVFLFALMASERATIFQLVFSNYNRGPWMCNHNLCNKKDHNFCKQDWEKHVTSLKLHRDCEGSGCAVCAKLDEHGLLRGKKAVAVEGGVPCEHADCQCTFTKAERRAKWYHLQYHPRCMNPCALCAKRTAEQPPGRLRSQWHATHPHR